jgi:hypothetical protein
MRCTMPDKFTIVLASHRLWNAVINPVLAVAEAAAAAMLEPSLHSELEKGSTIKAG